MNGDLLALKKRHPATAAGDEDGLHAGSPQQQPARPLERLRIVLDTEAEHLFHFRLVRRARRQAVIMEQPVAGIDQDRDRPAARSARQGPADHVRESRGDESRSVIRQQHGIALIERRREFPRERAAHRVRERPPRFAVDTNNLLLRRVNATCQNPGFDGRAVVARSDNRAPVHAVPKAGQQPPALRVGSDDSREQRATAERSHVVGGVTGAARDHFGCVVLQDEHGRLARHASDLAVNELVGDDVADDEHSTAGKAVDEPEKTLFSFGFAG